MTMMHFCFNIIIRVFKVGVMYLSRTDIWRTVKSVFPKCKRSRVNEVTKLSDFIDVCISIFSVSINLLASISGSKWRMLVECTAYGRSPGNSWLCLFIFICKYEEGLYTGKVGRVGSPALQLLGASPAPTSLIWLLYKLMRTDKCWLSTYQLQWH